VTHIHALSYKGCVYATHTHTRTNRCDTHKHSLKQVEVHEFAQDSHSCHEYITSIPPTRLPAGRDRERERGRERRRDREAGETDTREAGVSCRALAFSVDGAHLFRARSVLSLNSH
jgi:hypothetical protein